jgi:thymidylate synthase (FAD)
MGMVAPKTYLIGWTSIDYSALSRYLVDTGQEEFQGLIDDSDASPAEILCSFYAKLCYKSLVTGKNANISKIRGIEKNFQSTIESGHGSVLEHFQLNFVTTNCSRVFTHELVRHRVGTAFSQTSGRYVALGVTTDLDTGEEKPADIDFVVDPILTQAIPAIDDLMTNLARSVRMLRDILKVSTFSFEMKKKLTSAIRRLAPNGQANEIGWSANIRALRHMIEMRTSRHAEWEIRLVFNQVADIILNRFPGILYGHTVESVDGMNEYKNLKV